MMSASEAAREREAIPRTGRVDVMMMTRIDRVDVINDERRRRNDREALREREAIPRGDSHSDDRRWKMNSKDEKEEEEEEEEDGAKEAADNQFDDSE